MPAGTPIWVDGIGDGLYLSLKRNWVGANDHTIDFTPGGVQTVELRDRRWTVPGGVPGAPPPKISSARRGSLPSDAPPIATTDAADGEPPQVLRRGSVTDNDDPDLSDMVRLRKPKNMGDGALSALGAFGKGIGAGIAGFVAAPVVGAMEAPEGDGVKGFFKGLGAGTAILIAAPVAGVVASGVQLGRGVAAAVEENEALKQGKVWDLEKECWVERVPWLLESEAAKLMAKSDDDGAGASEKAHCAPPVSLRSADGLWILQAGACQVWPPRGRSRRLATTTSSRSQPPPTNPRSRRPTTRRRVVCTRTKTQVPPTPKQTHSEALGSAGGVQTL